MGAGLKSEISFTEGIKVFSLDSVRKMVALYHKIINDAAVKRVKVGL